MPGHPDAGGVLLREQPRLHRGRGRLDDPDLHADGHVHADQRAHASAVADPPIHRPDARGDLASVQGDREDLPDRRAHVRQAADRPGDPEVGAELAAGGS